MMKMAKMTTTEIAEEFGTTTRNLRKFLRSDFAEKGNATPGKGSRYAIDRRQLKGLQTRFNNWESARAAKESTDSDA